MVRNPDVRGAGTILYVVTTTCRHDGIRVIGAGNGYRVPMTTMNDLLVDCRPRICHPGELPPIPHFRALVGHAPYPWQRRLYMEFVAGRVPAALSIPTGIGKTASVLLALLARLGDSLAVRVEGGATRAGLPVDARDAGRDRALVVD